MRNVSVILIEQDTSKAKDCRFWDIVPPHSRTRAARDGSAPKLLHNKHDVFWAYSHHTLKTSCVGRLYLRTIFYTFRGSFHEAMKVTTSLKRTFIDKIFDRFLQLFIYRHHLQPSVSVTNRRVRPTLPRHIRLHTESTTQAGTWRRACDRRLAPKSVLSSH